MNVVVTAANVDSDETLTYTYIDVVGETQKKIATFMLNRANNILNNQTDLIGFVTGANTNGGGPLGDLQINAAASGQTLTFATSRSHIIAKASAAGATSATEDPTVQTPLDRAGTYDIWTEVYGTRSSSDDTDSNLWVGYLGTHYFISNNLLLGLMGQVDWADEDNTDYRADGIGWMIGPYVAGKLPDHALYYEARALWGRSDNNISPFRTYSDSFDTSRRMVRGKVAGAFELGHSTLRPQVSVSYFEETQKAYTDSLAIAIPEQTVSLGEVRFGPQLDHQMLLENGLIFNPFIGVSGVYNFGINDNGASSGFALGNTDLRARLDGGVNMHNPFGIRFELSGFYDGLGVSDYEAYGGSLKLVVPLN